jgi:hypothetical protein
VLDRVSDVRRSAIDGIADDGYDVAISVLERMADDLS